MFDVDWNSCIQCGACVAVCPLPGFTSQFDTIATHRPCDVSCMACERICPVTAISSEPGPDDDQLA
ncbi:4Fe-4S binding protein [Kitasatospora purpeofusca]|uniref:4Fe-4S binding protein n=1 Tax=Kitasatospora purpeofusca TaxID=67352 RepID=UPI0039A56E3F